VWSCYLSVPVTVNEFRDALAVKEIDGTDDTLRHLLDNLLAGVLSKGTTDRDNKGRDVSRLFRAEFVVGHRKGVCYLAKKLVDSGVDAAADVSCLRLQTVVAMCAKWSVLRKCKVLPILLLAMRVSHKEKFHATEQWIK
jgi:hypothetical protein